MLYWALFCKSYGWNDDVKYHLVVDRSREPAEDSKWVWAVPDRWYKRILWAISLPLILVMFITVPDCRQPRWKNWFIVTFVTSIIWIGAYSYLMVWMITIVGELNIGKIIPRLRIAYMSYIWRLIKLQL